MNIELTSPDTPQIQKTFLLTTPKLQTPSGESLGPVYLKTISNGKNPIHLISLGPDNVQLALKIFLFKGHNINSHYRNEYRFHKLNHPNVIKLEGYCDTLEFVDCQSGPSYKFSYLLLEYAPYGDLCEFTVKRGIIFEEKMARTYFHQFMEGLEYLHNHGVAHLDLKPENLLIGKNYKLKIADFDLSFVIGDDQIKSLGTKNYRAPELVRRNTKNPQKADIYSAGIILFFLIAGSVPFNEDQPEVSLQFFLLAQENPRKFWRDFCRKFYKEVTAYSKEFRELFISMIKEDPEERPDISDIKKSSWYKGPIYDQNQLEKMLSGISKN